MVRLRGWAIAKSPVTIRIYDENKEQLAADIQRTDRVDVDQLYDEIEHPEKTGFFTEVTGVSGKCLYVVFYAGDRKTVKVVPLRKLDILAKKADKYVKKGIRYWKSQGGGSSCRKSGIQDPHSFHKRDPISEVDHPPSSGQGRTGEAEKNKIQLQPEDIHCCTAVQNTGEISAQAGGVHSAADIYQLGAVSF